MSIPLALRVRRTAFATLIVGGLAACGDAGTPSAPADSRSSGQEAAHGSGDGATSAPSDAVVRGLVIGVDSAPGRTETRSPVAGASVTVILVTRDEAASDSSALPILTTQGTVTTRADGTFELGGVPSGYFYLDVVPPAASGFRSGRAGSVSFAAGSSDRALVYLYR